MSIQTFTETQTDVSQFASIHNARVRRYFRRNNQDQSEIAKQRAFLQSRLTIDPLKDSKIDCVFKCLWFDLQIANAFENVGKFYGMPIRQFQSEVAFKPQLCFTFREREINKQDLPLRTYKLEKQISFRLNDQNIPKTNQQLKLLAQKIKTKFWTANKAYNYTCGLISFRYKDDDNGYRLSIDMNTKASAAKLIDLLLDIQNVKYLESNLRSTKFTKPTVPERELILQNRVTKPIRGRTGKLYLYRVEYKHSGIVDKILIDQMGNISI
ncbi:MAG: hypothetical protein DCE90_14000 [Pseudanabaena sp.]|nr:MAG: hypothetical protein DCE90_14000 [Pseudanabaena sp.]